MSLVKYRTTFAAAVGAAALLVPASASAGTYTVTSCGMAADQSTDGWKLRTQAGMNGDLLCPWSGDPRRGIVVRNKVTTDPRVNKGRFAAAVFSAPPGTSLERMTYKWDGFRRSGEWTIGLNADRRLRAGCYASAEKLCALSTPGGGNRVELDGSPSVKIEARCESTAGCKTSKVDDPAQDGRRVRLSLLGSAIEIRDDQVPGVNQVRGGLWSEGWLRGTQSATFDATDNTGIRTTRFVVDGDVRQEKTRACRYTRPIPCENVGVELYGLDTAQLRDGDHELAIEVFDAAGNRGQATRTVRIDNNAPSGAFETTAPEAISIKVADSASGVDRAAIELRRRGTESWRGLDTALDSGRVRARIPRGSLAPGDYELRALLTDAAGNNTTVDRTADGSAALTVIPRATSMTAALGRGNSAKTARELGPDGRTTAHGRLRSGGQPLDSQAISVEARPRSKGARWRTVGAVTSGPDGRFTYAVPAGPSREIRFSFRGSERFRTSQARVAVRVPASSSIAVSRNRVRNGGAVRFSGKLRGGQVPANGKLIDLQAFYRGRWRTFALPRTNSSGRWRHRYEFGATSGLVDYRFRARLPREDGYPFEPGHSREVKVAVSGR